MEQIYYGFGAVLAGFILLYVLGVFRYIPNDRAGVVERLWSPRGSLKSGLIALGGEAGFQAQVLRGGLHFFAPLTYRIHRISLITIPQGQIGYVFARDGRALPATQALGANVVSDDFQDAASFLRNGGQRGPQRRILREGTYVINLVQFVVITREQLFYLPLQAGEESLFRSMAELIQERHGFSPVVIRGTEDLIGVVTVHDGPSLESEQIIAPTVGDSAKDAATYHNCFQDPEQFLNAGGRRGRQLQVLVEGTYFINRFFATIEMIPKQRSRSVVQVSSFPIPVNTGRTCRALTTNTVSS